MVAHGTASTVTTPVGTAAGGIRSTTAVTTAMTAIAAAAHPNITRSFLGRAWMAARNSARRSLRGARTAGAIARRFSVGAAGAETFATGAAAAGAFATTATVATACTGASVDTITGAAGDGVLRLGGAMIVGAASADVPSPAYGPAARFDDRTVAGSAGPFWPS